MNRLEQDLAPDIVCVAAERQRESLRNPPMGVGDFLAALEWQGFPRCIEPMDVGALRRSYRPEKVHVLLIGESAPASGKFFYHKGAMTTFTARAFDRVYGTTYANDKDKSAFLRFFQRRGCYLEDLCLTPVNTMRPGERARALQASVPSLSQRIRDVEPAVVVAVLRRIAPYVREALAGRSVNFQVLPFPGSGHQNAYIDGLSDLLRRYLPHKT
jgi:hypothetical protein